MGIGSGLFFSGLSDPMSFRKLLSFFAPELFILEIRCDAERPAVGLVTVVFLSPPSIVLLEVLLLLLWLLFDPSYFLKDWLLNRMGERDRLEESFAWSLF